MKASHVFGWTCLGIAMSACGGRGEDIAAPRVATAPVVYGADGRRDWYAIEDTTLKDLARDSVAAMIPWSYVSADETGAVLVDGDPTLGESYGLCADQPFRDQPSAGVCSGTLIDDDLLLTAGHCVPDLGSCADSAWVFDYLYESEGHLAPLDASSVYRCVDLIVRPDRDLDPTLDLAVIQLDRPVEGRQPAEVAAPGPVALGDPLVLVGFPNGIPLKSDETGVVAAPRAQADTYFIASVDAFSGNSGSGVLDRDLAVVGVLVSGADDYVSAGSCTVVAVLDPDDAEEAVMYAHHARSAVCRRGYPSERLCPDGDEARCGDGFCTDGETAASCAEDCDGLFAVPDGWTCADDWYAAGDDCDCDCGVYDPDCDDSRLEVLNCAPGSKCLQDGSCTEPIPEAWHCSKGSYGDGERCNCDCGAVDPDCADESLGRSGCAPGGVCQADGTCTISMPDGWSCRRRFYGTGDGCDCECGAYDPDCDDAGQEIYNCAPGSTCLADGSCEIPIPAAWVCDWSAYASGDDCDCNCGMYDPDCDTLSTVENCASGQVCTAEGTCSDGEPDPQPEPEPGPEAAPEAGPEPGPEPVVEETEEEAEAVDEPAAEDEDAADASEPDDDKGDDDASDGADTSRAEAEGYKTGGARDDGGCAGGGGGDLGASAMVLIALSGLVRRRFSDRAAARSSCRARAGT